MRAEIHQVSGKELPREEHLTASDRAIVLARRQLFNELDPSVKELAEVNT